jgi:RAD51-like protein 2
MKSVADMPLAHLPLAPSTLQLFAVRGFETVGEVEASVAVASSATASSSSGGGGFANLAAELSCGTVQEAHRAYREVMRAVRTLQPPVTEAVRGGGTTTTTATASVTPLSQQRRPPLVTASALLQQQQQGRQQHAAAGSIITFCRAVDGMLGGGIALGELTELAGCPGTGKTCWGMQLAVNAALPAHAGGVAGQTVYVDTEGSFAPERCHAMAQALIDHIHRGHARRLRQRGPSTTTTTTTTTAPDDPAGANVWNVTADDILEGIHVFRCHDVSELTAVLSGALPALVERRRQASLSDPHRQLPVRLVVIDSVAFPYRAERDDERGVVAADGQRPSSDYYVTRTRRLTATASALSELAAAHDLAVVAVNQMTTKIGGPDAIATTTTTTNYSADWSSGGSKLVPALGESWAHAVCTRLVLLQNDNSSSSNGRRRTCALTKSPRFPNASSDFQIVEQGVRGVEHCYDSREKHGQVVARNDDDPANKRARMTGE